MSIARARHNLNGVRRLEIWGWPGAFRIQYNSPDSDVALEVHQRQKGEKWTFADTLSNGVLRVHSSLSGSPHLLTKVDPNGKPWPAMIIRIPAAKKDVIRVKHVNS